MYTIKLYGEFQQIGRLFAVAILLAGMLGWSGAATAEGAPSTPLAVTTASGTHLFLVEVAETPRQRERGLMERRSLPLNTGMFFLFPETEVIQMWMKNTYVSLDMIFADAAGRVVGIATDTKPLSLEIISSGQPAQSVLEVRAGTAARLGIAVGDRVELRR